VLYGLGLILASYFWAFETPQIVDPNATASVIIVFGGATLLSVIGFALIGYRLWTRFSGFDW